jgi:phosphocarrier protein HPr
MSEPKLTRTVVITNPQGLHARPADLFVRLATRFAAKVEVVKDCERVDGKSILAIMTLAAAEGTRLSIEADGPDAQQALDALAALVEQDFAENENSHS